MIPNIISGGDTGGLMRYLVGPGRAAEHENPHVIAGSRDIVRKWGDCGVVRKLLTVWLCGFCPGRLV